MASPEHPHARLAQIGPPAWAKLHAWAEEFKAAVGGECGCGDVAVAVVQAFHDRVSQELGKPVRDPANLAQVAEWFSAPVNQPKKKRRRALRLRASGVVLERLPDVETQMRELLKRHQLELAQTELRIVR